jgi:O-antigen ligase
MLKREPMLETAVHARQHVPRRGAADAAPRQYTYAAALITVLGFSLGYSSIGFALLFFGAVWSLARTRRISWARTPLDLPLAVFGAVLIVSAAASPYPRVAMGVTFMLLVSGAVYFGAFGWVLRSVPSAGDRLIRAWAGGAVLAAVVGLAYRALSARFLTPDTTQGRAEIPHGVGPNGLGTTLMLGSILAAGLAFRTESRERAVWIGAGLCCLAGLLASGSRASVGGLIAGVGYLVWRELRGRPRQMAAAAAGGLLLLAAAGAAMPQFSDRVRHTVSDVNGNRVRIWHTSLAMIADRPWLGTGFGTFERAYDRRRAASSSSEPFAFNLWLNLAVETGLLGLAAALWIAIEAVRTWRRTAGRSGASGPPGASHGPPGWAALIVALWIGLLVDQLADNTLFSISTSAALWLLLAFAAVAPASDRAAAGRPGGQGLPEPDHAGV